MNNSDGAGVMQKKSKHKVNKKRRFKIAVPAITVGLL
jgi:hypothetical protein